MIVRSCVVPYKTCIYLNVNGADMGNKLILSALMGPFEKVSV